MSVAADNTILPLKQDQKSQNHLKTRRNYKKLLIKQTDEPVFVIQLAAFRSVEKAEEIASLLSAKHSSRLDGIQLRTMRLDTGASGIFFRVVSPPLPRAEAETSCTNLRRAGQDCFLRKFAAPEG